MNNIITDDHILNSCKKQSIKQCCMRVEDFVKTDLGFIDVIAAVYKELSGNELDYDSDTFDMELNERIFKCLDKIDKETPDPDHNDRNSDFNKRMDEAFRQMAILNG